MAHSLPPLFCQLCPHEPLQHDFMREQKNAMASSHAGTPVGQT
jgi:hypothetical protein